TGTASGFNSAIARTGGLIATALVGAVIGKTGESLVGAFNIAALIGAAMAVAAGLSAMVTLRARPRH
ncbi:MAG: transporter, partial [Sphingomonas bacterium]|nr:transporter [Sphingomonas bacterium]